LTLVIAGKFGWGKELMAEDSKQKTVNSHIKLLGYVPDEDLPALFAGAQVFVYPSLYEGFGLPILEAMASGCPVVTSNASSMPEVAGKASVLVNPEKVEDIARGIQKALENREELIKKGKARAREFSWEKTARETLKVYQEVYAHRS
jgi:glycosyltransferase involved in cell wall biosynthesis